MISAPLMYDARSDNRKATTSAISSGWPGAQHRRQQSLAAHALLAAQVGRQRGVRHRRLDHAGQHRVAPDPEGAVVHGDALGREQHGRLRRAVHVVAGEGRGALDRGDVDDRSAARPQHPPDGDRRTVHRPQLQHPQPVLDVLGRNLVGRARPVDPGVVHPVAERAQSLRLVGRALVVIPLADVAGQRMERAAELRRRAFERSLVTVDADHRDRVGQQPLRDRTPDAHRRPRDDGDGGPGGPGPLSLQIRHSGGISAYARSMSTPWLLRIALATK